MKPQLVDPVWYGVLAIMVYPPPQDANDYLMRELWAQVRTSFLIENVKRSIEQNE